MATVKMATEQEAKDKVHSSSDVTDNKMCTKARAIELGAEVSGPYADNLLVPLSAIIAEIKSKFDLSFMCYNRDLLRLDRAYTIILVKKEPGMHYNMGDSIDFPRENGWLDYYMYFEEELAAEYDDEGISYTPESLRADVWNEIEYEEWDTNGRFDYIPSVTALELYTWTSSDELSEEPYEYGLDETDGVLPKVDEPNDISRGDNFYIFLYLGTYGKVPGMIDEDCSTHAYIDGGLMEAPIGKVPGQRCQGVYSFDTYSNGDTKYEFPIRLNAYSVSAGTNDNLASAYAHLLDIADDTICIGESTRPFLTGGTYALRLDNATTGFTAISSSNLTTIDAEDLASRLYGRTSTYDRIHYYFIKIWDHSNYYNCTRLEIEVISKSMHDAGYRLGHKISINGRFQSGSTFIFGYPDNNIVALKAIINTSSGAVVSPAYTMSTSKNNPYTTTGGTREFLTPEVGQIWNASSANESSSSTIMHLLY